MKASWQIKPLGEVCDFQNGFAFKSNLFRELGQPILRISNIQDNVIETSNLVYFRPEEYKDNLDKYRVIKGDLLIAMSGATTGKIGFNTLDRLFYLNQRVGKFHPKECLSKQFLFYFLSTRVEENLRISAGAAQPNLSTEQIKAFAIPLPPLLEQQRIVSILDEAFAGIATATANAEKNLANARELFESYLQSLFESKGEDWEEKTLGEVCEYDKSVNKRDDLPYVGLEDIQSNTGIYLGQDTPKSMKSMTFYFNDEHVLYGRLRPYLNKVLLPNFEGHCSTEIFPIKAKKDVLDRAFLFQWLIANETMSKINATWTGATLPRANMNIVLGFKLNLPSLKEQQVIVQKLETLSAETKRLEAIYQQKLIALEELKKSILNQAFCGQLE